MIENLIIFVMGVAIGCAFILFIFKSKPVDGVLRIDNSDSDGPYLFLELSRDVGDITEKKHVNLDVKLENLVTRE